MAATFKIVFTGKKGDALSPLTGKIVVDSFFANGANGEQFLSADCVSARCVEDEVNALKKNLDKLVRTAKAQFHK